MSFANATPPLPDARVTGSLSISIVVYRLDEAGFARVLRTLFAATQRLAERNITLTLIDNSEDGSLALHLRELAGSERWAAPAVISGHGNVGYGAGHNLAIRVTNSASHLILNPDVELDQDSLRYALQTLADPRIVLVGAVGRDGDGRPGYLSKRMPGVWTFFLRGFAPAWLKRPFQASLASYEYHDLPQDKVSDVVLVSGAFMLCRSDALQAVGGFDERYFLHFEDLDLSLRMHARGRVVSDPRVTLIHHGGHSARKGLHHILLFARSAFRFFNTHGWRWL